MKTFGTLALALGMFASTTGQARAQPPGSYGPGRGLNPWMMLRNKGIRTELRATPEQARKLDAVADDLLAGIRKLNEQIIGLPQAERRPKYVELWRGLREDLHKKLAETLKPEQVRRFEQIDVQQAGVNAFEIARVQEALKLTGDQKAGLLLIAQNMRDSLLAEIGGTVKKDPEAAMGKAIEAHARALAECLATLTDAQKATWNDLNGEPFVIVVE